VLAVNDTLGGTIPGLRALDLVALAFFLASWIGYTIFADHSRWTRFSVTTAMDRYRRAWMSEMLARDVRILDTQIVGNLLSGIGFFASATILVVGGLVAVLGAADQALGALSELPFAVTTTRPAWEIKVLLLITIFVYAFFKFAWAFRLSNYCSILIGSAPARDIGTEPTPGAKTHAKRTAAVVSLSSQHFNRGLRAYFFALGALGWFVHPALFVFATAWVVLILYRREFRSRALMAVREAADGSGDPR